MCTTMILTPGAMANGAMTVTHSDDDELSDQRVIRVPAQEHGVGAMRPVLDWEYLYPRMNVKDRGDYYWLEDWPETKPLAEIPQVAQTYAYFDGNYGIVNEMGLMMGECTNGAKYQPKSVSAAEAERAGSHTRFFYSAELSRVALERCVTAREAVSMMGELIDTFGYFGVGETLLVSDKTEGWVFEMCALDDRNLLPADKSRHSAWIAQRVPEGEIFVAANTYRIREVPSATYEQIYSDHLISDLQAVGWYDPAKGPLDWFKAVSDGEGHPYYCYRRIWRVYDRVNPNLGLSPWVDDTYTADYPFSVSPARPLQVTDVFALYRDHYEGTEFDLTKGIAAGPYGDPNRFRAANQGKGGWERAISIYFQGYSFVLQHRQDQPDDTACVMWFGPDVASTTVYMPFYARSPMLPRSYQTGNTRKYDPETAWWVFDFVHNWARLNFQRMTKVDIEPLQAELEHALMARLSEFDAAIAEAPNRASDLMTEFAESASAELLQTWRELGNMLIAKYSGGVINPDPHHRIAPRSIGYSQEWLQQTNFAQGPTGYAPTTEGHNGR